MKTNSLFKIFGISYIRFFFTSISCNYVKTKVGEYLLNYKDDFNVVGEINENIWDSKKTLQLIIIDLIL